MSDYAEIYLDAAGEYRTRIKAANHEVIFDSAEGYREKADALSMIHTRFPGIEIVEVYRDTRPDWDPEIP